MYQSCRGKGKGRNRDKTRQLPRWQNRQNEEGLINTSKSGNGFHGFGMKSIREIVTRYEGVLNIDVTGDTFRLSIVFFK